MNKRGKLRLDVEALSVEEFATAAAPAETGTVQAFATYDEDTCFGQSCRKGTYCWMCEPTIIIC